MAKIEKDKKFIKEYGNLPDLIKKSFIELFWDEKLGYLADYVNDDEGRNLLSDQIWLLLYHCLIQCLIRIR